MWGLNAIAVTATQYTFLFHLAVHYQYVAPGGPAISQSLGILCSVLCSIHYKRERAGGGGAHGCISARLGRGIYPFLCIPPARAQVTWLHLMTREPGKCHQPCVQGGKEGSLVNKQPDSPTQGCYSSFRDKSLRLQVQILSP